MNSIIKPLWRMHIGKGNILSALIISFLFFNCTSTPQIKSLRELVHGLPSLEGKQEYLSSPFITAGDRLYLVGHQDGTFPDLGWHVTGEMGGVWDHPIKLLDGFRVSLSTNNGRDTFCLAAATGFTNYPVGN